MSEREEDKVRSSAYLPVSKKTTLKDSMLKKITKQMSKKRDVPIEGVYFAEVSKLNRNIYETIYHSEKKSKWMKELENFGISLTEEQFLSLMVTVYSYRPSIFDGDGITKEQFRVFVEYVSSKALNRKILYDEINGDVLIDVKKNLIYI